MSKIVDKKYITKYPSLIALAVIIIVVSLLFGSVMILNGINNYWYEKTNYTEERAKYLENIIATIDFQVNDIDKKKEELLEEKEKTTKAKRINQINNEITKLDIERYEAISNKNTTKEEYNKIMLSLEKNNDKYALLKIVMPGSLIVIISSSIAFILLHYSYVEDEDYIIQKIQEKKVVKTIKEIEKENKDNNQNSLKENINQKENNNKSKNKKTSKKKKQK